MVMILEMLLMRRVKLFRIIMGVMMMTMTDGDGDDNKYF